MADSLDMTTAEKLRRNAQLLRAEAFVDGFYAYPPAVEQTAMRQLDMDMRQIDTDEEPERWDGMG